MVFDINKVRCSVGVEDKNGKLRLRLPATVAEGSKRYISTGLDSTAENVKQLQKVVLDIEQELTTKEGCVSDEDLARWKSLFASTTKQRKLRVVAKGESSYGIADATNSYQLTVAGEEPQASLSLLELWEKYCEFRKPQVATTTYIKEYKNKLTNHVKRLHDKGLAVHQAVPVRDFLLKNYTPNTTKRVLTYLQACCDWGVKSGLLTNNPYRGMATDIKLQRNYQETIDPFSTEERDVILTTFKNHPTYSHYYSFIRFLFLTGCRTGECIGLQWKHVSKDCKVITFSDSVDSQLGIRKDTKTHKVRRFPCNSTLQDLLLNHRPLNYKPDDLVFTTVNDRPINNGKFLNQVWRGCRSGKKTYKGLVTQLVEQGLVERYRPLYNTRHTFITMCLENGMTASQTAKLVGNSPEVIMRHYCGSTLKFEVPVN